MSLLEDGEKRFQLYKTESGIHRLYDGDSLPEGEFPKLEQPYPQASLQTKFGLLHDSANQPSGTVLMSEDAYRSYCDQMEE